MAKFVNEKIVKAMNTLHRFEFSWVYDGETKQAAHIAREIMREALQENVPVKALTREQVEKLDGKPVWVREITPDPIDGNYWGIVDADYNRLPQWGCGAIISPPTNGISGVGVTPLRELGVTYEVYTREITKEAE